ncbi:MAG: tetratricopeptide repeat protein [Nitrospina sp.]|jgi:tetratricopeptide (TPR) repeat protein|nr:tetratricopeptide repeat protein [Nitrospina sp.]MBT7273331.1 tetratricopeptide repeat protein [Nitrospina sp.]|tara:strand:- start:1035 stop:1424 length:390 start_codon:yes stop_codon:yes gene_type:complete
MKLLINILVILFLILLSLPITLYAENLIGLPRTEGSKSFDMEINQLNNIGIKYYSLKELDKAEEKLKKATNLAQQLRDPSLGVIAFNRALVLHHLHKNKEAIKYFTLAKRYARGDIRILNSQILKNYTK